MPRPPRATASRSPDRPPTRHPRSAATAVARSRSAGAAARGRSSTRLPAARAPRLPGSSARCRSAGAAAPPYGFTMGLGGVIAIVVILGIVGAVISAVRGGTRKQRRRRGLWDSGNAAWFGGSDGGGSDGGGHDGGGHHSGWGGGSGC